MQVDDGRWHPPAPVRLVRRSADAYCLAACEKPIVTTLHTLLTQPEAMPRHVVQEVAARSQAIIVMTKIAARLLVDVYGVSGSGVTVIPHGVPAVAFDRDEHAKAALGLAGRKVMCTFGLINRGKGIEHMIRAMPRIVAACPEATYMIVGATHPHVKPREGEGYREGLAHLADSLGVGDNVCFVNEYARPMVWANVGRQHWNCFGQAVAVSQGSPHRPVRHSMPLNGKHRHELLLQGVIEWTSQPTHCSITWTA